MSFTQISFILVLLVMGLQLWHSMSIPRMGPVVIKGNRMASKESWFWYAVSIYFLARTAVDFTQGFSNFSLENTFYWILLILAICTTEFHKYECRQLGVVFHGVPMPWRKFEKWSIESAGNDLLLNLYFKGTKGRTPWKLYFYETDEYQLKNLLANTIKSSSDIEQTNQ